MSAPCYRAWGPLHGILGVCTLMSGPPVCVLSLFKFFVRSAVACADSLQSMCDRAVGDACICPNSYRDLYKTQHDCGRKKSKLRRSIVFRLRRTSPPRRRRCRRLASYGLLAFASYGLLALASYGLPALLACSASLHCLLCFTVSGSTRRFHFLKGKLFLT